MWVPSRNRIIDQLKTYSIKREEEFTLASGQKSNVYIDVKKMAMRAYAQPILADSLILAARTFGSYQAAAGVALGGCHLASLVGISDEVDVIYVRKESKSHGSKTLIEAPTALKGKEVILFEDVITTGASVLAAAHALIEHDFKVKGIVALVDRRDNKNNRLGTIPFVSIVEFEELI